MHNDQPISWPQHLDWFERLAKDASRSFWVFYQNERPVGVLNFSGLDSLTPEWGCYLGETDIWPGSGLLLEVAALDYAATWPEEKFLLAEVLSFNQSMVKLHRLFQYEELPSRPGGTRQGLSYDVLRFRYPVKHWPGQRNSVLARLPGQIRQASQLIEFV